MVLDNPKDALVDTFLKGSQKSREALSIMALTADRNSSLFTAMVEGCGKTQDATDILENASLRTITGHEALQMTP